jgi:hypothetical protein
MSIVRHPLSILTLLVLALLLAALQPQAAAQELPTPTPTVMQPYPVTTYIVGVEGTARCDLPPTMHNMGMSVDGPGGGKDAAVVNFQSDGVDYPCPFESVTFSIIPVEGPHTAPRMVELTMHYGSQAAPTPTPVVP